MPPWESCCLQVFSDQLCALLDYFLFLYFLFPWITNSYLSFPAGRSEWPSGGEWSRWSLQEVPSSSCLWNIPVLGVCPVRPGPLCVGGECTGVVCWEWIICNLDFWVCCFLVQVCRDRINQARVVPFPQGYLAPIVLFLVQFGHGGVHWTGDLQEEIYWCVTGGTGDSSVPEK